MRTGPAVRRPRRVAAGGRGGKNDTDAGLSVACGQAPQGSAGCGQAPLSLSMRCAAPAAVVVVEERARLAEWTRAPLPLAERRTGVGRKGGGLAEGAGRLAGRPPLQPRWQQGGPGGPLPRRRPLLGVGALGVHLGRSVVVVSSSGSAAAASASATATAVAAADAAMLRILLVLLCKQTCRRCAAGCRGGSLVHPVGHRPQPSRRRGCCSRSLGQTGWATAYAEAGSWPA